MPHGHWRVSAQPDGADWPVLFEVGGTYLRAARALPSGPGPACRELTPSRTSDDNGPDAALGRTLHAIERLGALANSGTPPARAVVAWPGPVSPDGRAYASPTVAGCSTGPVAVAELLSRRWSGAEVILINDVTAAGLRLCEGGLADFAVVTVGSGIGHKVFAGGRPLVGPAGLGGELGHLVVREGPGADECDCGGRGHLGALASGRAIVRRVTAAWNCSLPKAASVDGGEIARAEADAGRAVVAAFGAGDRVAEEIVDDAAHLLGRALAGLHLGVGVDRFVLVGGFAVSAGEPYRRRIAAGAEASCWNLGLDWDAAVTLGSLDDEYGLVGAWLTARERGWL